MVQWDLPRTPSSVLLLAQLGAEHGVPEAVSLSGTHLDRAHLADPGYEVTAAQELRVIRNLVEAVGGVPGLGLEAGVRYHLTTYGIWGFALISSPTMRSAIEVGLRYLDLTFAFCRIRAEERDDELRLVLDPSEVPLDLQRFVVERDGAAIQTIARELYAGPTPLQRIAFAFPAPESTARYAEVFGVVPTFGAPESAATVDRTLLDLPLPQADAHTTALAQQQCRELLTRRRARPGTAGQVRDLLLSRISCPPREDEVAAALHLSDRTLRHRLAAQGTSLRALLAEVREQLAEELLVTGGLPVAEVARRLGYVEVSSFSQAFRRWKGVGPRAYRSARVS